MNGWADAGGDVVRATYGEPAPIEAPERVVWGILAIVVKVAMFAALLVLISR